MRELTLPLVGLRPLLRDLPYLDVPALLINAHLVPGAQRIRLLLPELADRLLRRLLRAHELLLVVIYLVVDLHLGSFDVIRSDMVSGRILLVFVATSRAVDVLDIDTVPHEPIQWLRPEMPQLSALVPER